MRSLLLTNFHRMRILLQSEKEGKDGNMYVYYFCISNKDDDVIYVFFFMSIFLLFLQSHFKLDKE